MKCAYDGRYKVVSRNDEHTTPVLCRAHAEDWVRVFPGSRIIEPSVFHDGRFWTRDEPLPPDASPCTGDWPLPAKVPA